MHWLQDIIRSTFIVTKSSRKGWLSKNCPCCIYKGESADTRHRLGMNLGTDSSIRLNCFNCGLRVFWSPGRPMTADLKLYLTASGYTEEQIRDINFNLFKEKPSENSEFRLTSMNYYNTWNSIELPLGANTLQYHIDNHESSKEFIDVLEYAVQRKLFDFSRLYWTPLSWEYKKRLIIPFYYEDKLVGYSGRYVYPDRNPKNPKYLDNRPDNYVYNLHRQRDTRKYTIYPEGLIDAMHMDGICTFGNKLTDGQSHMINQLGKTIIFIPDYDNAGEELLDRAIKQQWLVSLPDWKYKDISESVEARGRIVTLREILNSVTDDAFRIRVKWKMILRKRTENDTQ